MRKSKNILPEQAMKSLYYSLFHSHLIYCIQIWSCTSHAIIKPLVTKQKMAIRLLHQSKYNAHTESLFKNSKILPLILLANYFKIQFIHRYVHNHLPACFDETWTTNEERRRLNNFGGHDLRPIQNADDFYITPPRLAIIEKQPLASFAKLWNEFPELAIKRQPNKLTFNISLKKFFIDKLADNYVCDRLFCPHCQTPP